MEIGSKGMRAIFWRDLLTTLLDRAPLLLYSSSCASAKTEGKIFFIKYAPPFMTYFSEKMGLSIQLPRPELLELLQAPRSLIHSANLSLVQSLSRVWLFVTPWMPGMDPMDPKPARLPCPSLAPGVCSDSCLLSQWCYLTISSSVTLFTFCFQSFPESGSFLVSQFFASVGQSTGASASTSVLPVNIQTDFL